MVVVVALLVVAEMEKGRGFFCCQCFNFINIYLTRRVDAVYWHCAIAVVGSDVCYLPQIVSPCPPPPPLLLPAGVFGFHCNDLLTPLSFQPPAHSVGCSLEGLAAGEIVDTWYAVSANARVRLIMQAARETNPLRKRALSNVFSGIGTASRGRKGVGGDDLAFRFCFWFWFFWFFFFVCSLCTIRMIVQFP